MKRFLFLFFSLASLIASAQEILTLKQSYKLAETNYPLAKQSDIIQKKTSSEISILDKGKLPQLDLNAQASYQSDVIQFAGQIPNINMETPNKDQYRATLDANQLIYNGGHINAQKELKTAQSETQLQQIEVNLYTLKSRINQSFFSVLLLQEQASLLQSKKELLHLRLKEIESGIKYGAILPSAQQVLKAEVLKLEQEISEAEFDRQKAVDNLSSLLAQKISTNTILKKPNIFINDDSASNRPEFALFNLQENQLEVSKNAISKSRYPKLSGFTQLGYGNPGLNMLDNSFQDFYIVGLKLNWNIFDWGKTKKEKQVIEFSKEIVSTEKETFKLNNDIELQNFKNDIDKYREMLEKDDGIIAMYEEVVKASVTQLNNGVISSSEYITELNKLYEAKINQQLHEIQLGLVKANYRVTKGDFN